MAVPDSRLKKWLQGEELMADNKGLTSVPLSGIAKLLLHSNIVSIDLSYNKLTSLTQDFARVLGNVKKVSLSHNSLQDLPENFGTMRQLLSLECQGNRLATLPLTFRQLTQLTYLNMSGNPVLRKIPLGSSTGDLEWTYQDCVDAAVKARKLFSRIHMLIQKEQLGQNIFAIPIPSPTPPASGVEPIDIRFLPPGYGTVSNRRTETGGLIFGRDSYSPSFNPSTAVCRPTSSTSVPGHSDFNPVDTRVYNVQDAKQGEDGGLEPELASPNGGLSSHAKLACFVALLLLACSYALF